MSTGHAVVDTYIHTVYKYIHTASAIFNRFPEYNAKNAAFSHALKMGARDWSKKGELWHNGCRLATVQKGGVADRE